MKCPKCDSTATSVEQVRADSGRRRRKCRKCGHVFHTREVVTEPMEHGGDRHSSRFKEARA